MGNSLASAAKGQLTSVSLAGMDEKPPQGSRSAEAVLKVLLLGSGEVGKTTLMRQLRLFHGSLSRTERLSYGAVLRNNVLTTARQLVLATQQLGLHVSPDVEAAVQPFLSAKVREDMMTPADWEVVAQLLQDPAIAQALCRCQERADSVYLHDAAPYFLTHWRRFTAEGFLPSDEDVAHARVISTGIADMQIQLGKYVVRFVDVGGQRNERRKWIHLFDDVAAIVYVVSLSEFDQFMREDHSCMRVPDSLSLFAGAINDDIFADTPVFLVGNKRDLFMKKVQTSDFAMGFPAFQGDPCRNPDGAIAHVFQQYRAMNHSKGRTIQETTTTATDKSEATQFARDLYAFLSTEPVTRLAVRQAHVGEPVCSIVTDSGPAHSIPEAAIPSDRLTAITVGRSC